MRLLLICAGGLSTGILERKVNEYAKSIGDTEFVCKAHSFSRFGELHNDFDVTLYGPQVRNQKIQVFDKCEEGYPLEQIELLDYGTMNGKNIYEKAMKIHKSNDSI
ncbi:PTS sugar transporter subunit IIB [Anaerorhabdus sp.]|uniref:PTS sugar transporter subunit IIB n=1 Tax=Anaerorhabdus sp. TaxID=1872524 RepID=UPI002FC949AC